MKKQTIRDLTVGSPFPLLISFSFPIFLGFLLQYFYSLVDMIVVGKFLGTQALAGVGATGGISHLITGFCSGACSGFAIPIAISFGRKDYDGLRKILGTIFWLCLTMSVSFALIFSMLCRSLLLWLRTPAEALPYAHRYLVIILLGIPATILYNILSGIIRSLGDARTPLLFLVVASILNIGLDLLMVVVLKIGVVGAALATILAQLLSGIFCFLYVKKNFPILKPRPGEFRFRREDAKRLLGIGIPMGLQVSYIGIGNTIVQTAVNTLGPTVMASVAAGSRIMALLACPYDSIGTATSPYVGQNLGAGQFRRIHLGNLCTTVIGTVYWVMAIFIAFFFSEDLLMLFVAPGEPRLAEILRYGRLYLIVSAFGFLPLLGVNIFRFSLQGMGCSKLAMVSGVMEMVGRVVIALVLVPRIGYPAVCLGGTAAWILADCFVIPMYFHVIRKLRRQAEALPSSL